MSVFESDRSRSEWSTEAENDLYEDPDFVGRWRWGDEHEICVVGIGDDWVLLESDDGDRGMLSVKHFALEALRGTLVRVDE